MVENLKICLSKKCLLRRRRRFACCSGVVCCSGVARVGCIRPQEYRPFAHRIFKSFSICQIAQVQHLPPIFASHSPFASCSMDGEQFNTCPASPPQRLISLKNWRELSDAEFQLLVNLLQSALPHHNSHPLGQLSSRFGSSPSSAPSESSPSLHHFHPSTAPIANASPITPAAAKFSKSAAFSPGLAATARKTAASSRAAKRSDVPVAQVLLSPHPSVLAMQEREQERLRRREEVSQPATALPVD